MCSTLCWLGGTLLYLEFWKLYIYAISFSFIVFIFVVHKQREISNYFCQKLSMMYQLPPSNSEGAGNFHINGHSWNDVSTRH